MALVLGHKLINETNLGVLEVFGLRVIVLLPGELLGERISQPDVNVDDMISVRKVHFARFQHILNSMVSVHQGPGVRLNLAVEDLGDGLTKLTFRDALVVTLSCSFLVGTEDNTGILTIWLMPNVFVLLSHHKTDGGDRLLNLVRPLEVDRG